MYPSVRRLPTAVTLAFLLTLGFSPGAATPIALAGTDTPPRPFDFGNDAGVGALAADGDTIDHVAIWWDEVIDPGSLPARTDFSVSINGTAVTPSGVEVVYAGFAGLFGTPEFASGLTLMRLPLPATWTPGDAVNVTYTPGANPVRDLALNEAAGFTWHAIPWDFFDLAPLGAVVDSAYARDRILLVIQLPIVGTSIPAPSDFTVLEDTGSGPMAVDAVSVTHVFTDTGLGVLELQLPAEVADANRTLTVSYTPGAQPITGARDGALLDAFSELAVQLLLPVNGASDTVAAGGSVTTTTDAGPTASDPVGTTVTSPTGGEVTVQETTVSQTEPAGYSFFGQQVEITAPPAESAENPLVISFEIDASLVPAGQDHTTVEIFRNGVLVPDCTGPTGVAEPSPCVSERVALGDGDIGITILTVEASSWNFGFLPPYEFGGFQPPVDDDLTNLARAGSAIPVKFSLGGDRGLDVFEAGSPSVRLVDCTTGDGDLVETTVTAGESSLSYDASTDSYTYVWKTSTAWRDSCRELVLDFADGSQATALFDFSR